MSVYSYQMSCQEWPRSDTLRMYAAGVHCSNIPFYPSWASQQIRKIAGCACASECRGRSPPTTTTPAFKRNHYLATPAYITARASRTCRDACWDRLPAVQGKRSRHSRRMRTSNFTFLARGPSLTNGSMCIMCNCCSQVLVFEEDPQIELVWVQRGSEPGAPPGSVVGGRTLEGHPLYVVKGGKESVGFEVSGNHDSRNNYAEFEFHGSKQMSDWYFLTVEYSRYTNFQSKTNLISSSCEMVMWQPLAHIWM